MGFGQTGGSMSENESSPPDEVVRWVVPFAHRWAEARAHVRFAGRMGVVVVVIGVGLLGHAALGEGDYVPGLAFWVLSAIVLAIPVIGGVLSLRWPVFIEVGQAGIRHCTRGADHPRRTMAWPLFRGHRVQASAFVLIGPIARYRQWRGVRSLPELRVPLPSNPHQQRRVRAALARHLSQVNAEAPPRLHRARPSLLDGRIADVALLVLALLTNAVAAHHRVMYAEVLVGNWLVAILFGPATWLCIRDHGPLAPLREPFRELVFAENNLLGLAVMLTGLLGWMVGMVTSLP